jgi:hypothetical protein
LLAIPSSLSRSYSIFPLCSWTTLIEIAVCWAKTLGNVLYSLDKTIFFIYCVVFLLLCDRDYHIVIKFKKISITKD